LGIGFVRLLPQPFIFGSENWVRINVGAGRFVSGGAGVELAAITPGMVGQYLTALGGSPAKRNQHLAALRGFFDRLVNRHVVILNPAASVKGVKDTVVEGKTPEITIDQARKLLASIKLSREVKTKEGEPVEVPLVVGLRDRAILATLAYTACRAGAVAKLRLGDFQDDGTQYALRFQEKGGKSREIPVRHDLEGFILAYVDAAGIAGEAKDSPLFRAGNGRTRKLSGNAMTSKRICELVKRRLKDAGLPLRLSPHSFRVTAITSLLEQGVPMEDVQYLAGHAEPRTTTLYDRRKKRVTRNIVERIPI
jgi:integrase/recombinase XerD